MKLIYDKDIPIEELNIYKIRIESDSYILLSSEALLVDFLTLVAFSTTNQIDYNDLRKYAIINILPHWNDALIVTESNMYAMIGYYIVPNDWTWDASQQEVYTQLVLNATKCRQIRVDKARSYIGLYFINDVQKSIDFYIDTELLIKQYVEGKIPSLQAFINSSIIMTFDYTVNGFASKTYYNEILKAELNYLLFR